VDEWETRVGPGIVEKEHWHRPLLVVVEIDQLRSEHGACRCARFH
jgi:hypothetical protein